MDHIYKVLSSNIFTWYMKSIAPIIGSKGISLSKEMVETFPLSNLSANSVEFDYQLTQDEIKYIEDSLSEKGEE